MSIGTRKLFFIFCASIFAINTQAALAGSDSATIVEPIENSASSEIASKATPMTSESTVQSSTTVHSTSTVRSTTNTDRPIDAETPAVKRHPKVALALGGGGTRGAAHIGVLRVLQRENIPIDYVAGTSIGAVIGGLYCAGLKVDEIERVVLDKQLLHAYLTVPIPIRIISIPILFIPHLFGYRPYDGLYKGNEFRTFLHKAIPEGNKDIENLPTPFCAVASSLTDGTAAVIKEGNLGKAIQASSAIPFLRRPVHYDTNNQLLVDGAIEANLPVQQARDMGGDIVIAVPVDEDVSKPIPPANFRHILTVPPRVISMLLAKLDSYEASKADILVAPKLEGISLLSHKVSDAKRAIQAGEDAAEAALPAIRARLNQPAVAETGNATTTSN